MKNILLNTYFVLIAFVLWPIDGVAQKRTVLIAYHSVSGHTEQMAMAIQKGIVEAIDITVKLKSFKDVTNAELLDASAIVIGSPVYNANPSPEILSFVKTWPFEGQPLRNKLGAVFVTAGGLSSGEELVQSSLLHAMMVYGMIVVGGDGWRAAFGASAIHEEGKYNTQELDPYFLEKGIQLGRRVATLVTKLN